MNSTQQMTQTLCLVITNKKKEVADINYLLVQQPEGANTRHLT